MPRIRQLPSQVVTKIAAGEVIERPGSVIKELLENSIDAGAKRIDIEVEAGGVDRIMVSDDGCGIEPEDLPLALTSHATSKLSDVEDLFRVQTLGFRGEALASIAGVAHVTIQSVATGASHGAEIRAVGGQLSPVQIWNGTPGTRIEVRHLFFNTPVRKKFLRAPATEMGHINEQVSRLALAYPTIHFTLKHQGRVIYDLPATSQLVDRIEALFGPDLRAALYEIRREHGSLRLAGYIADPSFDRPSLRWQYLFVNGRFIRDRSLSYAIQEAYRGLLMTGRYAATFLYLEIPPDAVDVNVHPTKTEVRFRDASTVFHLVLSAVRSRLNEADLTAKLELPKVRQAESGLITAQISGQGAATAQRPNSVATDVMTSQDPIIPNVQRRSSQFETETKPVETASHESTLISPTTPKALQIHNAYLVLETPEGILVIDQHALHERILFEQFQQRLRQGPMERQRLLIPEPIELGGDMTALALSARNELQELGWEIDEFGPGTIVLHSYPTLLQTNSPSSLFRYLIEYLGSQGRLPPREVLLNRLTSTMACKAAVKAGDRLTPEQIQFLLDQRHLAQDSHHCPHGRPTSLMLSRQDLDRQFGRI
jgi:DNA mismatch repair protein MutL